MQTRVIGRMLFGTAALGLLMIAFLSWTEPRALVIRDNTGWTPAPAANTPVPDIHPQQLLLLLGVMQQRG
ncbi:hypothetical protein [Stutzerimonas tarimensis]|uniref:Uncharacterized protein n=1 Tax=Stutzerimonas tarimensis TaxID=1507735 RepID=A0ABV7T114_9GAMM